MQKKFITVVEEDEVIRTQLVSLIDSQPDLRCIGVFASAGETVREISMPFPDVVLMDISLPGMSGIECVAELTKRLPWVKILMLTVHEDCGDCDRILLSLKAGARGYLLKSSPPEILLAAIRNGHTGSPLAPPCAARMSFQHIRTSESASEGRARLSARELEVMRLLAVGLAYREIGYQLGIASETVRIHVKNTCSKLQVRNKMEAVAKLQGSRLSVNGW